MSHCPYCGAVGASAHQMGCPRDPITNAERHHDVLCLVLKAQAEAMMVQARQVDNAEHHLMNAAPIAVDIARAWADLAYPPPKAEGA